MQLVLIIFSDMSYILTDLTDLARVDDVKYTFIDVAIT